MRYQGLLYADTSMLEKLFGLPEDTTITNIIHDPITGGVDFVIWSHEEKTIELDGILTSVHDGNMKRRVIPSVLRNKSR